MISAAARVTVGAWSDADTAGRTGGELTERQRQVLSLLAAGKTNREIGDALGMTLDGAKFHVSELLTKLEVSSREEAAEWWRARSTLPARAQRVFSVVGLKWAVGASTATAAVVAGVMVARSLASSSEKAEPPDDVPGFVSASREDGGLRLHSVSGGWTQPLVGDAVEQSQVIALGRVTAMSEGLRSDREPAFGGGIYRIATFELDEVIRAPGGFSEASVPVYVPGGQFGDVSVYVADVPQVNLGDRAVLFLNHDEAGLGEPGMWVIRLDVTIFPESSSTDTRGMVSADEALEAIRAAAR